MGESVEYISYYLSVYFLVHFCRNTLFIDIHLVITYVKAIVFKYIYFFFCVGKLCFFSNIYEVFS